jgi:D-3-phosphoglycerate dehydrogenase
MARILIATAKPFSADALEQVKEVLRSANYQTDVLSKYSDQADLVKAVADVDALIVRSDIVDKSVIGAARNLKIVVRAGAGYDNVDLEAARAGKVVVMNTKNSTPAELARGMLVYKTEPFHRYGF